MDVDLRANAPDAPRTISAAVATPALDPTGDTMIDLTERRCDVVRRLLDRGVPALALRALLPGWDPVILEAQSGR